jgi:chaperonin GroES
VLAVAVFERPGPGRSGQPDKEEGAYESVRCTTAFSLNGSRSKSQKRIIPDTAKEKPQEGKVIAAGSGKIGDDGKRIALDVKTGDRILFGKYSGSEVKIDDKEYLILREEDVLAVLGAACRRSSLPGGGG